MVRAIDVFCGVCEIECAWSIFAIDDRFLVEYFPENSEPVRRSF